MNKKELEDKLLSVLNRNHFEVSEVQKLDNELDHFFGIEHKTISADNLELYPDISSTALSTSYLDYFRILSRLPKNAVLVDLGAGYCRGTLLATFLKTARCISIELSSHRVDIAKKALARHARDTSDIIRSDLRDISIPTADYYYLYFPLGRVLCSIIRKLLLMQSTKNFKIVVCEAHGDTIDFFNSLDGTLGSSPLFKPALPRHKEVIYEYIVKSAFTKCGYAENLNLWWLWNFDSDDWIVYKYDHQLLKSRVQLLVSIQDVDLIKVNERFYLQNIHSGRVYNTDLEFRFVKCVSDTVIAEKLQLKPREIFHPRDKILLTPELIVENPQGKLLKASVPDSLCRTQG